MKVRKNHIVFFLVCCTLFSYVFTPIIQEKIGENRTVEKEQPNHDETFVLTQQEALTANFLTCEKISVLLKEISIVVPFQLNSAANFINIPKNWKFFTILFEHTLAPNSP